MDDPIITCALAFLFSCAAFFAGTVVGVGQERRAWVMRALTKANPHGTAHHCDGEFYYVVQEDVFVNEYKRRNICPPKNAQPEAKT